MPCSPSSRPAATSGTAEVVHSRRPHREFLEVSASRGGALNDSCSGFFEHCNTNTVAACCHVFPMLVACNF